MTENHQYKWTPGLPHMEARRFIAERLRSEVPSPDLDAAVCDFLGTPFVARCTTDLNAAVSLIPDGWWWFLSHLEAKVTPTKPVPGAPISNGTLYDHYGAPVGFSAMCWDRKDLPVALCEALLKARYDLPLALVVEASESEHTAAEAKWHNLSTMMREPEKKPRARRKPR